VRFFPDQGAGRVHESQTAPGVPRPVGSYAKQVKTSDSAICPGRRKTLLKAFRVQNGQQLQFRWEAFNVFNTPQWRNPNRTLGNSNVSIISSTRQNNARHADLAQVHVLRWFLGPCPARAGHDRRFDSWRARFR
jgi:hypothetical protein